MDDLSLQIIVFLGIIFFFCLAGFIIYFIVLYQKKQIQNRLEKEHLQSTFRQELLKTQIEVQEQTLTHISREIHDNITQVLSFVKLNLGMIDGLDVTAKNKVAESRELVAQTINDLRNLSRSLSFEHIMQLGLVKTIEIETERLNNSRLINTVLSIGGDEYSLGEQRELVLFRIFQEALNNTLKHSGAKQLKISLQYSEKLFNLTLEDDGAGFSTGLQDGKGGAGLRNMANRAALIGGEAIIKSSPGNGCSVTVSLNPLQLQQYNDSAPADSFG